MGGVKICPSSVEDVFLGAVGSSTQGRWTAKISMNGNPMELQIDTGAEVSHNRKRLEENGSTTNYLV